MLFMFVTIGIPIIILYALLIGKGSIFGGLIWMLSPFFILFVGTWLFINFCKYLENHPPLTKEEKKELAKKKKEEQKYNNKTYEEQRIMYNKQRFQEYYNDEK